MRRRRARNPLGWFYFTVLSALLIGGSIWLDRSGVKVQGRVADKHELITVDHDPTGGWSRRYELGVAFATADGTPMAAAVEVPASRYESLRPGDAVEIRYLPALPVFARTVDRSTATVVSDMLSRLLGIPLLLWLGAGVVALWIAARMGTVPLIITAFGWSAASFPLLFAAPTPPVPAGVETTARVRSVTLVTKSPARRSTRRRRYVTGRSDAIRRLDVPYQVVQMMVAVPGRPDSVVAVDAVDSGSVPGLLPEARLAVRRDIQAPRSAKLVRGTRTFVDRNRYHLLIPVQGACALGLLAGLTYRRKSRRPRVAASPATVPV